MINTIDKTSLINVVVNTDGNISAENTDFHQCQNTHQYQQQVGTTSIRVRSKLL